MGTEFHNPRIYEYTRVALPQSQSIGWALAQLGIPKLHVAGARGEGVVIAYVDTGVSSSHPDLVGAILDARDFTGSPNGAEDIDEHGTHTFGTALARDNNTGMLGVAPLALGVMGKGLGDDGSGDGNSVSRAMRWAVDTAFAKSKAVILSMSLGSTFDDPMIDDALRYCISKGAIPILAAGNDGGLPGHDQVGYPARLGLCPAIAAYGQDGSLANFSSQGPEVTIAAPGVKIVSTIPGGYVQMSGTSMATPFVSGVVALYLGELLKRGMKIPSALEMMALLAQTADDKGPTGKDWGWGNGSIDPTEILASVPKPLPPPVVPPVPPAIPGNLPPLAQSLVRLIRDLTPYTVDVPSVAGKLFSVGQKP